jgi:chromosomal replication initiation ATPase DnaA
MVIQKARVREPVILMGETGCGKTYLVKYIAEVIFQKRAQFHQLTFHYGKKEEELIEFMTKVIQEAKNNENEMQWVFFDEFNTSSLQPYVAELLVDRVFSLVQSNTGKCSLT